MKTLNRKILYIATIFLAILYVFSFTKSCSSKDRRKLIKTALVNPKYKNSISEFELYKGNSKLTIKKTDNFWTIKSSQEILQKNNDIYQLPASDEKMKNFINTLTGIVNMYKISDDINKGSAFGLSDFESFHIKYHIKDGEAHELIFGKHDFSQTSRFFMTDKNTAVYETNLNFDSFLTTSIQSWAEPFIISQEVFGKIKPEDIVQQTPKITDLQKFLELRHGGFPSHYQSSDNPDTAIIMELGNKKRIVLNIFKTDSQQEYIVKVQYFSATREGSLSNDNAFYTSHYKISYWTYNKIKEITL